MNRSKKMMKDILLFAMASFGPKLLSFFLVPLYTSCLSTEAYGTADLLNTIYSLILPILMLDISDAIIIKTMDWRGNKDKSGSALKYGFSIYSISAIFLAVVLLIVSLLSSVNNILIYCLYIFLQYSISAIYNNLLAYLRGIDKVSTIVTASIIQSIFTIVLNILLILQFQLGLVGLLIASIIGGFVADIYIALNIKLANIFKISIVLNSEEKKSMLAYSIPLIFTGIAWWINNSSDRLFISMYAGVSFNGIYAVANKIPTILNACHSIVYQAMQLSVFSERKSTDKKTYYQKLYNIYNFLMTIICCILITANKLLAHLLFKGNFFEAWKFSPALLISVVLYSVSGFLTTLYAAENETKLIAKATLIGAFINSILNIILIPHMQLYGAVIATLVGYFVIWLVMIMSSKRMLGINLRYLNSLCGYSILVLQWLVCLTINNNFEYGMHACSILIIFIVNKNIILEILSIVKTLRVIKPNLY